MQPPVAAVLGSLAAIFLGAVLNLEMQPERDCQREAQINTGPSALSSAAVFRRVTRWPDSSHRQK